jgi:F-box-like
VSELSSIFVPDPDLSSFDSIGLILDGASQSYVQQTALTNFATVACLPGDISNQIRLLEQYAKSTFDILGHLPSQVAVQVLAYLTIPELLGIETVSKKWSAMVRHPAIWRYHCLALTTTDPVPLRPPSKPEDWCVSSGVECLETETS